MKRGPGGSKGSQAQILTDAASMRAWSERALADGQRIALVPTMGFLHEGHLALVREARQRADRVVVSIFVNPTQFGPNEDLARYPRDLEGDVGKLASVGVDAVFAPATVYPEGFDTYVVPETLAKNLCGARRPGHFRGVCTVVLMLFRITRCHVAVFGEKDYQQLQVIRRMTRDLWLDVDIVGVPTVREADGLAMSSRNTYLGGDARRQALALPNTLKSLQTAVASGWRDAEGLLRTGRQALAEAEGVRLDYLEIVDAETLRPITSVDRPARAVAAVFVGTTRLIDNVALIPAD